MDRLEVVSHVNQRTLLATLHYARGGKTLCGRRVGRMPRWFAPLPWEHSVRVGLPTCPACAAQFTKEHTQCAHA